MEKPSFYEYGFGQLISIIAYSGLILLYARRAHFAIAAFTVAILAISIISTIWSGHNIGIGTRYFTGLSIRHCAVTLLLVLFQGSGVLSGGQLWLFLATFFSLITIAFSVIRRLRRQDSIIEEWEKSGKFNAEKRQIKLGVSVCMHSQRDIRRIDILKWIGVFAIISAWLAAKVYPELSAPIVRLVCLGLVPATATWSSYPIATVIILGRIEKRLGGPLLTEYSSGE